MISRRKKNEGMALPMVLWTIALLGGIAILLVGIISGWTDEETRASKLLRAREQALSGLAMAMNPAVAPGDPLLKTSNADGSEGYSVTLSDDSGLINPNVFLGASPDRRDLLKRLFNMWGLKPEQADTAADCLYDWQNPSPFRSLHGAKAQDYEAVGRAGLPPGAPFTSPEEMTLVLGFDPVTGAKPDWQRFFTTSWQGKVNLLHAPKEVLVDFVGLTPSQADAWITLRNGKDGIEGTPDDLKVKDLDQAAMLIGAAGGQKTLLEATSDVTGNVRRIESSGFCNGVKRVITVIVSSGNQENPQSPASVLGWSER
jgi:Type II secretion system (T2SS), protein K